MTTPITVTHADIPIVYSEKENVWRCEIRGRERSFPSLEKARESIDRPEPNEKAPFVRVKGWRHQYSKWEACEVTSVADAPSYSTGKYVWISIDGSRSKERSECVILDTPENLAKILQWKELEAEMQGLRTKRDKLEKSMTRLKV